MKEIALLTSVANVQIIIIIVVAHYRHQMEEAPFPCTQALSGLS